MISESFQKRAITVSKYLLSIALVAALCWKFRGAISIVQSVTLGAILCSTALQMLQPILIGIRWLMIVRSQGSKLRSYDAIRITWVSVLANQFLPASVGGDVLRATALLQRGEPPALAVGSVLLDRLLALLGLVIIIAALLPWLTPSSAELGLLLAAVGAVVLIAIPLSIVGIPILINRVRLPNWLGKTLNLIASTLGVLKSIRVSTVTLGLSVSVHVLSLMAFVILARGIGVSANAIQLVSIGSLLAFIQVLPISIGGWGPREAAAVFMLGSIGIDANTALALSILLGISYGLASLPGIVLWLIGPSAQKSLVDASSQ